MGQSIKLVVLTLVHKVGLPKEKILLLEAARSFLFTVHSSKACWGNVVVAIAYLINRMPLKTLDFQSSLESFNCKNEYIVLPKVVGCVCFVHARNSWKLDPRTLISLLGFLQHLLHTLLSSFQEIVCHGCCLSRI